MKKLRNYLIDVRSLLNTNKILFETITTLSLTIMALIVSFVALKIDRRQLEIEEIKNAAYFDPHVSYDHYQAVFDDGAGKDPYRLDNDFYLYNKGAEVKNIEGKVVEIVQAYNMATQKVLGEYKVNFWNTFERAKDFTGKGLLGTFHGWHPSLSLYKIIDDTLRQHGLEHVVFRHISVFKFAYIDALNTRKEYYYWISKDDLTESEAKDYYNEFNDVSTTISLTNIPPQLFKNWSKAN